MLAGSLQDRIDRALGWLVLALAFLMPLSRGGVTATTFLLLALWLAGGRWRERWQVLASSRLMVAIALFLLLNIVSLAWSAHRGAGLEYVCKYHHLLVAAVLATAFPARRAGAALDAFLVGSGLSLVWSYGIFFGLIHFGKGYPEHAAPSMNHLDYSMFVATAALLTVVRLVRRPTTPARRAGWVAFLLFAVGGLLINIGRSGQLAFFATLVVLLTSFLPGPRLLRAVGAVALVALLLAGSYAVVPPFRHRVDAAVDEVRLALVDHRYVTNQGKRIAGMIVAAEIVRRHPLLGTGVGANMDEFHRLVTSSYPDLEAAVGEYRHLHNQYLQVTTELGAVGLAALLAVFVVLLRTRTGSRELDDVALVTASVFLVGCVADPFLRKQLPLTLFAFLVGLVAAGAAARAGAGEHGEAAPPRSSEGGSP